MWSLYGCPSANRKQTKVCVVWPNTGILSSASLPVPLLCDSLDGLEETKYRKWMKERARPKISVDVELACGMKLAV